jgi:hypothetical protein
MLSPIRSKTTPPSELAASCGDRASRGWTGGVTSKLLAFACLEESGLKSSYLTGSATEILGPSMLLLWSCRSGSPLQTGVLFSDWARSVGRADSR